MKISEVIGKLEKKDQIKTVELERIVDIFSDELEDDQKNSQTIAKQVYIYDKILGCIRNTELLEQFKAQVNAKIDLATAINMLKFQSQEVIYVKNGNGKNNGNKENKKFTIKKLSEGSLIRLLEIDLLKADVDFLKAVISHPNFSKDVAEKLQPEDYILKLSLEDNMKIIPLLEAENLKKLIATNVILENESILDIMIASDNFTQEVAVELWKQEKFKLIAHKYESNIVIKSVKDQIEIEAKLKQEEKERAELAIKAELETLKKELAELKAAATDPSRLQEDLKKANTELNDEKQKVSDLQTALDTAKLKIVQLQVELNAAKSLDKDFEEAKAEAEKIKQEVFLELYNAKDSNFILDRLEHLYEYASTRNQIGTILPFMSDIINDSSVDVEILKDLAGSQNLRADENIFNFIVESNQFNKEVAKILLQENESFEMLINNRKSNNAEIIKLIINKDIQYFGSKMLDASMLKILANYDKADKDSLKLIIKHPNTNRDVIGSVLNNPNMDDDLIEKSQVRLIRINLLEDIELKQKFDTQTINKAAKAIQYLSSTTKDPKITNLEQAECLQQLGEAVNLFREVTDDASREFLAKVSPEARREEFKLQFGF